jgi:hypothetical protein
LPKPSPRARRLAIEKGSEAPARNEKAGWIRSWSEQPLPGHVCRVEGDERPEAARGEGVVERPQCIASASIRNITKPRNTSIDGTRGMEAAAAGTGVDVLRMPPGDPTARAPDTGQAGPKTSEGLRPAWRTTDDGYEIDVR